MAKILRELEEMTLDLRDRKDQNEVAKDGAEVKLAQNLLTDVKEKQRNLEDLNLSVLLSKVSTLKRELRAISKNLQDTNFPSPQEAEVTKKASTETSKAPPTLPTQTADPSG